MLQNTINTKGEGKVGIKLGSQGGFLISRLRTLRNSCPQQKQNTKLSIIVNIFSDQKP